MQKILLLEDDPLISKSLKMSLSYEGFSISVADTLEKATALLATQPSDSPFSLLILDVNLPDGTSFDFCRNIRAQNELIPIIMLTARVDEESAVRGITNGADDYVRKPFGVGELVVRINRLLNRKAKSSVILSFGTLKMDLNSRKAWANSNELNLGKREFEILRLLIKKQGDVTTRNEILDALGEESEIYDRTIDSHLSHLRKKIRQAQAVDVEIHPVYGVGYRLELK